MSKIRAPAVAGMFYPSDADALRAEVRAFVDAAGEPSSEHGDAPATGVPKAIIAPHAGYCYSGPIAGSVYACVSPLRGRTERVVLLGPAHRVAVQGLAVSGVDAFETPLGQVPLDAEAIRDVLTLRQVAAFDDAHADEHSLEVQLPFLQEVLGSFRLVPLVFRDVDVPSIAEVLERLWGGPETLIVVSSDLSHFHDYASARRLDRKTASNIESLSPVESRGACGRKAINGLLLLARARGLTVRAVDVRNSGDTSGDLDRVVGYGGFVFSERAG